MKMRDFNKIKRKYSHREQALRLILNAPPGNILDKEMIGELTAALVEDAANPAVKAILFQGEGEHFSFGASVPEHQKEFVGGMLASFHQFFRTLIKVRKSTFALVRGQCLGGGLELAAFCNWIFASEDAVFGQPEIKLAVFPPVASLVLPYRIGQSAADDLILTGRLISAQVAREWGLVYSVSKAPESELDDFVAEHILPKSAVALEFAVNSSRYEMRRAFVENIDALEKLYVQELMETEDANEGIRAFMEKRKPLWSNK